METPLYLLVIFLALWAILAPIVVFYATWREHVRGNIDRSQFVTWINRSLLLGVPAAVACLLLALNMDAINDFLTGLEP